MSRMDPYEKLILVLANTAQNDFGPKIRIKCRNIDLFSRFNVIKNCLSYKDLS
jgi:hypothetical protein